ncbi:hypothetical protein PINS_up015027 [Pythium insidiosum]|nr:hypothetical protein PINS_up015027 [Pythium insidiosum]
MTPLENETLHLWIQKQIHLPEPPFFLKETHTSAERDVFADYHRDHLGFRLYVIFPVGITLSEANAKYHFCFTALKSAKTKAEQDRLLQLFRDALTTLCEPKSRIATLRFVHPETVPQLPKITASPSEGDLASLLARLRAQAAPAVAQRLAKEAKDHQAEAVRRAQQAAAARQQRNQIHRARKEVAKQLRALQREYRTSGAQDANVMDACPQVPVSAATASAAARQHTSADKTASHTDPSPEAMDTTADDVETEITSPQSTYSENRDRPDTGLATTKPTQGTLRPAAATSQLDCKGGYYKKHICMTLERASLRAVWLDKPHPRGPERIIHHLPTPGEAYEVLRVFLRHRVTPMVLVHTTDYFNCLRFPDTFYHEWTSDDTTGQAMRTRMDQALAQLGWYVAPRDPHTVQDASLLSDKPVDSGSLYTPSETLSDGVHPAQLPDSDEPLPPTAYYALLRSINPRRRRRGPLALVWAQAERLNKIAYETWNQLQPQPSTEAASQSLASVCRLWSASPPSLLALLRALPYPEATISLLPPDRVRRLGNELNALAPELAHQLWTLLLVLIAVAADEATDTEIINSIQWLRQHEETTVRTLHELRRYDWTSIAGLARAISPLSAPTNQDDHTSEADRL